MRSFRAVRFSRRFVAFTSIIGILLVGSITYAAIAAGVTHTSAGGWTTCTHDDHANVAHNMIVRNNGSQPMCIGSSNWGDNFTVQQASVTKNWANFPNIYVGCELDGNLPQLCTSGMSTPTQVKYISKDISSVSYYYPQQGFAGNTAYDIWFNKTGAQPQGRDNGAEIMVWLGSHGIGKPVYTRKVYIDGVWWGYDSWRAGSNTWNYVRYWRLSNYTPKSAATLDLVPFFKDAEHMGKLSTSWFLTGTEYGFEICHGGRGAQIRNFTDTIVGPRLNLGSLQHKS
jgi:hypothetical protein